MEDAGHSREKRPGEPMSATRSKITSISMEHFKGFERARVSLGDFTVLVGTNASGKSNVGDALRFLHGIGRANCSLDEIAFGSWGTSVAPDWEGIRGGANDLAYFGTDTFAVEVGFSPGESHGGLTYRIEVRRTAPGRLALASERLVDVKSGDFVFDSHPPDDPHEQPSDPQFVTVRFGRHREPIVPEFQTFRRDTPVLSQLAWRETRLGTRCPPEHVSAMSALYRVRFPDLRPTVMRRPSPVGRHSLADNVAGLSSVLQNICETKGRKSDLLDWLSDLAPIEITDIEFILDPSGRIHLYLVDVNGHKTSAESISDGTLRVLALLAMFFGRDSENLYFIDELETGIHPTRQHLLVQIIESRVREGATQVIATTHSPQLLAFLSPESVENAVVAYRYDDETTQHLCKLCSIPSAREVLDNHHLAELHGTGWLEDAISCSRETDES